MINELNTWLTNLHMDVQVNANTIKSVTLALVIFLSFWLLSGIVSRWLIRSLSRSRSWTGTPSGNKLVEALGRPLRFLLVLIGIYLALRYLFLPFGMDQGLVKIFRSLMILSLAWVFYNLAGTGSLFYEGMQEKLRLDNILLSFLSKFIRFLIVAFSIVIIAEEWNYPVNGFIAGLGLGGLAVALAAKEALANIVGGIVIILEKPFLIGDWVSTPSGEGTVEDISFRSTRIRSSTQALITVPNSTLANQPITNHARMGKRKLEFHLNLPLDYQRPHLESLLDRIRKILDEHPEVEADTIVVSLENIGKESLEILLRCFISNPRWEDYMRAREQINLEILELIDKN
ncbi:MAG TPA: mechanosensitive ion channel domain-containing protein [Syntrophomonadaceae bacterium]|nr:mechanosensitive ion channel domain-containing protein [Syntrophomonadaceae bacterium]